jgi:hypothetical protein
MTRLPVGLRESTARATFWPALRGGCGLCRNIKSHVEHLCLVHCFCKAKESHFVC